MAGKGSGRREGDDPVAYANNFDRIFRKNKGEDTVKENDEMITLHDKEHSKEASETKPVTVRDKSQTQPSSNLMDKVAFSKE
jgi:hypothetical protein